MLNLLLIGLVLLLATNPAAKATVLRTLMGAGLFKAHAGKTTVAEPLPGMIFTDVAGNRLLTASLKGKVIFLNFWAGWCPPCIAEMPGINELYKRFSTEEGVVFIMVDADSDLYAAERFLRGHDYSLPVYRAAEVPANVFGGTLPTTLVIDKKGNIVFRETGTANYNTPAFMDFLHALAAE